jgi:myo-inositol-1(or 4)-monophosphatase
MTLSDDLSLAIEAVRRSGEMQLAMRSGAQVSEKSHRTDIVTNVDLAVERMFHALVAERRPGDGVLGEELAEAHGTGGRRWLFDPVDGTANFASGLPFFCASLALEVDGVVTVAAVYEPSRGELFTAERGHGAHLNGQPIHVSQTTDIADAMIGCGFPHGATSRVPEMERLVVEFAVKARGFRRLGSAALDLSYVACGRLDAFWDKNLKPWDTAAGALIVSEAGGHVTALDGGPFSCYGGGVLASNGRLHVPISHLMHST